MLRTNNELLSYVEQLHKDKNSSENIFLKSFSDNQLLLRQGALPQRVFVIKQGMVSCFISEDNGKDFIVEFLSGGEIVGEIEAMRNVGCICSVKALTSLEVYCLTIPFFKALLQKDLHFNKMLLQVLADRISNTSSRAAFQQLYTLEHGLAKLLELQSEQNINLSKEQMAAYLGVSVRSLNRGIKNIEKNILNNKTQ